jgi:hypothetical protein
LTAQPTRRSSAQQFDQSLPLLIGQYRPQPCGQLIQVDRICVFRFAGANRGANRKID